MITPLCYCTPTPTPPFPYDKGCTPTDLVTRSLPSPTSWRQCNSVVQGGRRSQSYWILPRELGWRISFQFNMTFLLSQRWSAPPLPPSFHNPTEQPRLHCCLSLIFLNICQPIHLTFLLGWDTSPDPQPTKGSNSRSSSIFPSAVYTDLNISIAYSAHMHKVCNCWILSKGHIWTSISERGPPTRYCVGISK